MSTSVMPASTELRKAGSSAFHASRGIARHEDGGGEGQASSTCHQCAFLGQVSIEAKLLSAARRNASTVDDCWL